jgi:hypothetical protein
MAISVTDHFRIDKSQFAATGALDTILDVDSRYFLDPKLLKSATIPEFKNSYRLLEENFENVLKLLAKSTAQDDIFWKKAYQLLPSGELKGLNLGYSAHGSAGSGFGPKHKTVSLQTAKRIIDAGIEDPTFFELLGVFEKGIGADRISDLICLIIAKDIISYSERVFRTLGINMKTTHKGQLLSVPTNPNGKEPVLLLPKELLRDLPVAHDWESIDVVCAQNQALREDMNEVIGHTWKRATSQKVDKDNLKKVLLGEPELLKDMISVYQDKYVPPYDFKKDPAGEIIWYETGKRLAKEYPFKIASTPQNADELIKLVRSIVDQFKQLVEHNGAHELLYKDKDCLKHKPERAAQKLFFAVADSYCKANDIDLSPETHSGRGSVDFKLSKGYAIRVIVETKLSTNSKLVSGYEGQINEYVKAEKIPLTQSFYVPILVTASSPDRLKQVEQARGEMIIKKLPYPELISINAQPRPTASKI